MINYDNIRGGIVVNTENGGRSTSRLTIHDVIDTDSGNYTCETANAEQAYVYVFVSEGKLKWHIDIWYKSTSCNKAVLYYNFVI